MPSIEEAEAVSRIGDRREEIAAFCAAHAGHVQTRVARRARTLPEIVEDACATAWTQLQRRPDVELSPRGVAWLITVRRRQRIEPPRLLPSVEERGLNLGPAPSRTRALLAAAGKCRKQAKGAAARVAFARRR